MKRSRETSSRAFRFVFLVGERAEQAHAAQDPVVLARVPGDHPAERHQDDQRTAARIARQHAPLVSAGAHRQPRLFRELRQTGDVQEAVLRPGVRARLRAGAPLVRADRLEHPVRLRRRRPADQRPAAAHVRQRQQEDALCCAQVRHRRVQLRRSRDGRQRSSVVQHAPPQGVPAAALADTSSCPTAARTIPRRAPTRAISSTSRVSPSFPSPRRSDCTATRTSRRIWVRPRCSPRR